MMIGTGRMTATARAETGASEARQIRGIRPEHARVGAR
jgi:hypothetical protein